MDFVMGLPTTFHKNNVVWVIMDRLTKSAHFIPIRMDFSLAKLTKLYIKEIMRLQGVPSNIVSNRDPRFTSRFWISLHKALGTRLDLNTAIIPKLMGNLIGPYRPWRTCFVVVSLTSEVTGMITFLWWILLTIIATRLALTWHHMRLYMGDPTGHRYVGQKKRSMSPWVLSL